MIITESVFSPEIPTIMWPLKLQDDFWVNKYACLPLRQQKWQKKLSTLSTHKIMLTLMDRQWSDWVRAAHEHVWSVCLCSFVLSTLAHRASLVRCDAVRIWACSSVFPALVRAISWCTLFTVTSVTTCGKNIFQSLLNSRRIYLSS